MSAIANLFAKLSIKPDGKSFAAADKLIGGLKFALGGLVAFAAGKGMLSLIEQTTEVASKAVESAAKLGISAEAVQELGYAAGQTGTDQEGLTKGLLKFSKTVDTAKHGSKDAARALRAAGVDVKGLADGSETLDGALEMVAKKFAEMPDGYKKAALAQELFGKSGTELIPLLNSGQEGIKALRQEAQDLGAVIDNETAAALEDFGDQQDKVKAALGGLRNEVVKALLPTLQKLVAKLLAWVKANRKLIALRLEQVMRVFIRSIELAADAIGFFLKVLGLLRDNLGLTVTALAALGVAMLIFKAKAIAAAIASAAAWIAATAPIILYAAAIAAAILIIEDLYFWVTGKGSSMFEEMYNAAKTWIGDKLTALIGGARLLIQEFLGIETDTDKAIRKMNEEADAKTRARVVADFGKGAGFAAEQNARTREAQRAALRGELAGGNFAARYVQAGALEKTIIPETGFGAAALSMAGVGPAPQNVTITNAPQMQAQITIDAPGGDPTMVRTAADAGVRSGWDRIVREAQAQLGAEGAR